MAIDTASATRFAVDVLPFVPVMHTDPRSLPASVERTSPSIRIATAPGVEPPGRDVNADIAAFVAFAAATAIMDLIVMVSPKNREVRIIF